MRCSGLQIDQPACPLSRDREDSNESSTRQRSGFGHLQLLKSAGCAPSGGFSTTSAALYRARGLAWLSSRRLRCHLVARGRLRTAASPPGQVALRCRDAKKIHPFACPNSQRVAISLAVATNRDFPAVRAQPSLVTIFIAASVPRRSRFLPETIGARASRAWLPLHGALRSRLWQNRLLSRAALDWLVGRWPGVSANLPTLRHSTMISESDRIDAVLLPAIIGEIVSRFPPVAFVFHRQSQCRPCRRIYRVLDPRHLRR
jgi:hypothetical protein